jgi:3-hydroxyacyl-CoA dehydrogenase
LLKDDVKLNKLRDYFINVATAKVATSAHEAYDLGFFQEHKDIVVVSKELQLATAKRHAILMLEDGYTQPVPKKALVYGQQALGMFMVGTDSLEKAKFASEHDKKIANKLGYIMAGGDLSEPTYVSEQYLLDLEREAIMSLFTERKTLERIEHMLKTGKPLRN